MSVANVIHFRPKPGQEPYVHLMVKSDGTRVYRTWEDGTYSYSSPELTESQLRELLLKRKLARTLIDPKIQGYEEFLDLSDTGVWWSENMEDKQPRGMVEETRLFQPDVEVAHTEAWWEATVAAMAVRALQAHVAAGGSLMDIPTITFPAKK